MDAKTFLMEYENADRHAKMRLEMYEADAAVIKDLVQHRKLLERQIGKEECKRRLAQVIRFNDKVRKEAAEAIKRREEIRSVMDRIEGIEGDVIRARHIEGLIWNDIADKLFYSYTGVFKAYDRGLRIVQAILDEEERLNHN